MRLRAGGAVWGRGGAAVQSPGRAGLGPGLPRLPGHRCGMGPARVPEGAAAVGDARGVAAAAAGRSRESRWQREDLVVSRCFSAGASVCAPSASET